MAQYLNISTPETLFPQPDEPNVGLESLPNQCYGSVRSAIMERYSPIPMFYYGVVDQEPHVAVDQIKDNAVTALRSYHTKMWLCAYDIGATLDKYIDKYYFENPDGDMNIFEAAAYNEIPHTVAKIGDRVFKLFKGHHEALWHIEGIEVDSIGQLSAIEFDTLRRRIKRFIEFMFI